MPYCSRCGLQLSEDARFCPNCGNSVEATVISSNQNRARSEYGSSSHSVRYLRTRRGLMIAVPLSVLYAILGSLRLIFRLAAGVPLQPDYYTYGAIVFDIMVIMVVTSVLVWWWRKRVFLDEPFDETRMPKISNLVLITLGAFLFGVAFGINVYTETWGLNNLIFVPSRDLNANSPAGAVYNLMLGVGMVLLLVGVLNMGIQVTEKHRPKP